MTRALVLVHDTLPGPIEREVGSVGPALRRQGHDVLVAAPVPDSTALPDPADVELVVVLGSDESAYQDTVPWVAGELAYLHRAIDAGTPVLGICFGGQLLARALGGTVARGAVAERGFVELGSADEDVLPAGTWMQFHYDSFTVPPGARLLAANAAGAQAFDLGPHLGVQFHPEISPEAFAAWIDAWQRAGVLEAVAAQVDLPALTAEIADRAEASAAACAQLVDRFCRRL